MARAEEGGREQRVYTRCGTIRNERKVETRKKKKKKNEEGEVEERRGEEEEEASERTEEEVFARGWHEREEETAPSPSPLSILGVARVF